MQTVTSPKFSGAASGIAAALVMALSLESAAAHAQSAPATPPPEADTAAPAEAAEPPAADEAAPAEVEPPGEAEAGQPAEAPSAIVAPIEAAPLATAPVEPPAPPSHLDSYVMWGVGGASLVAGTVFGVMALSANKDFDEDPTTKQADKTHNLAIASDVGLGLGLILGITGTIFYFSKGDDEEKTASASPKQRHAVNDVRVAPFVSSRASGGTLSLRF